MTKKKVFILAFVLLFPSVFYVLLTAGKHDFIQLPYYGPKQTVTKQVDGKEVTDTLYHTIPPFSFIDEKGDTVTNKTYAGKIYVANFFHTTGKDNSPKMATLLKRVQDHIDRDTNVFILSHTVDPIPDSVQALAAYAKLVHADTKKWTFVTGGKKEIYNIARNGYDVTNLKTAAGIMHCNKFFLVDKKGHVRGVYNGTLVKEADRLIDEIHVLEANYFIHNKDKDKNTTIHIKDHDDDER